jgi:hypothetical protein
MGYWSMEIKPEGISEPHITVMSDVDPFEGKKICFRDDK